MAKALSLSYPKFLNHLKKPEYHASLLALGLWDLESSFLNDKGLELHKALKRDQKTYGEQMTAVLNDKFSDIVNELGQGIFGFKKDVVKEIRRRLNHYSADTVTNVITYFERCGGFLLVKTYRFNPDMLKPLILSEVKKRESKGERVPKLKVIEAISETTGLEKDLVADRLHALSKERELRYQGGGSLFVVSGE